MKTYGGSEFDENDFLLFATKIKYLTYNTYLEVAYDDETPRYKERTKKNLADYKVHIKEELLDSYGKKSKFNELNDMVVKVAKDDNYQEVADVGSDELYDFTGLTEKILKKIGISYVLTPEELESIRNVLESSSSEGATDTQDVPLRTSSRTSIRSSTSSSSSRGRTKKKKPTKKKKKPTKKKKKPTVKKKKNTKKKKMYGGTWGEGTATLLGNTIGDNITNFFKGLIKTDDKKMGLNEIIKEGLNHLISKGMIQKIDVRELLNNLKIDATVHLAPHEDLDPYPDDSNDSNESEWKKLQQEHALAAQEDAAAAKAAQEAAEAKAAQEAARKAAEAKAAQKAAEAKAAQEAAERERKASQERRGSE